MTTLSAKLTFHIPHAQSLKDKRMVARSLIDRTRQNHMSIQYAQHPKGHWAFVDTPRIIQLFISSR